MNYLFDKDDLADRTQAAIKSLAKNKPDANFTEFAASVIFDRLKSNIQRYRVYGPYWWALKDVLRRMDYNVGDETDSDMAGKYCGSSDAETLVAADAFYLDMSKTKPVNNNTWTLDDRKPDYVLYDSDMEERASVADSTLAY
ncbi:hypothetical protein EI164_00900 [Psychrobacter sp. FME13]|uniref:hypothetical protein n=1 Tax=Psychrobacter sp. FME13 TaxID=2487708 RepID=UPI001787CE8C|nr:hypothetical protein [Psychrobacter sp. FME13]MBE0440637.1 hypothetical protein [Psychrobacter sp. FME13]